MTRLNITIPDEIARELKQVRNKSRFIAEALRLRFEAAKKKHLEALLVESYKKVAVPPKKLRALRWELRNPQIRFVI